MLEITSARYGAVGVEKDKKDITANVKRLVSSDKRSISVVVGPSALQVDDPSPGNPKELSVHYSVDGDEHTDTIRDGFTFSAAVPEKLPQSWASFTAGLYGAVWKNMWGAFVLFAAIFSIGLAFGLGSYLGNPIVWLLVALLFPYASFWLILGVVVLIRVMSPTDVIKPFQ